MPEALGAGSERDSALVDYLVANRGSATWIVAVSGAQEASALELQTGLPVMAMGGWSGSDNALTLDELKADIANGTLRYVILGGQGRRARRPATARSPTGLPRTRRRSASRAAP